MKIACLALAASLLIASTAALAQAKDSPYVDALSEQANHCTAIATSALAAMKAPHRHGANPLNAVLSCVSAAEARGIKIYKRYAATQKDPKIRADMKNVLIAWLVWMPAMIRNSDGIGDSTQDASGYALNKAIVTLRVDKLIQ